MNVALRLACTALLILLLKGSSRGQAPVDSILHCVDSLYASGAYSQAELEARRLLENELLSDSLRNVADQWVAFALVAQRQPILAREHFTRILRRRPQYEPDPTITSPKILAVFNDARVAFQAARAQTGDPRSGPPILPPRGITFRTVVFPGWEQIYHRRTTAGALFLGAGIVSLGAGVALEFARKSAREDYLTATVPEDIESKYRTYNRTAKGEGWAFAAFAAVYLLSEVDVFINDSPASLSLLPGSTGQGSGLLLRFALR